MGTKAVLKAQMVSGGLPPSSPPLDQPLPIRYAVLVIYHDDKKSATKMTSEVIQHDRAIREQCDATEWIILRIYVNN